MGRVERARGGRPAAREAVGVAPGDAVADFVLDLRGGVLWRGRLVLEAPGVGVDNVFINRAATPVMERVAVRRAP